MSAVNDPTQAPNFETKDAVGGVSAEVKSADAAVAGVVEPGTAEHGHGEPEGRYSEDEETRR